jgi:type III restriction enzyme
VESRDNPTEIVVHVNMLKEGWDVTNLYTIVPLRAANSKTLVEQSIGRGLRLPYGKRVEVAAVDRLTIVSHDRFQEIIDEASKPDSIIRTGVVIGRDIPDRDMKVVEVTPLIVSKVFGDSSRPEQKPLFTAEREQAVARTTLAVLKQFEKLPRAKDLQTPENLQKLIERVQLAVAPAQGELAGVTEQVNVADVVAKTVDLYVENTIDIPRIVVLPKGEVTGGYRDFELDLKGVHLQPVAKDILIAHLNDHQRYRLISGDGIVPEERPEDYLVRGLIDFDDVSYDEHADLLYKLAGQIVKHLQSYLTNEDDLRNVLQYHQTQLVNIIHLQMHEHYEEKAADYEAHVTKGFTTLRPSSYSISVGEEPRDFRTPVEDKLMIRGMLFAGFTKCLYPTERFHSDTERRFATLLENDPDVVKWFKPDKEAIRIYYKGEGGDVPYEPDFIVETKSLKLICETKAAKDINTAEVQEEAKAAVNWCEYATTHEKQLGGKAWAYLLIPHDAVNEAQTIQGLAARFTLKAPRIAVA